MNQGRADIGAVILAGGASRRFGGAPKALLPLDGRPLICRVAERLVPQVGRIVVSANDPAVAAALPDLPALADPLPDRPGPLAGILAALDHFARDRTPCAFVLSVPCDCPFLPGDLAARLVEAATANRPVVARFGAREHFVTALWPMAARDAINEALKAGENRVGEVLRRLGYETVAWADDGNGDPFLNINTPDDLAAARRMKNG